MSGSINRLLAQYQPLPVASGLQLDQQYPTDMPKVQLTQEPDGSGRICGSVGAFALGGQLV